MGKQLTEIFQTHPLDILDIHQIVALECHQGPLYHRIVGKYHGKQYGRKNHDKDKPGSPHF